ncbi:hypothetical protein [Bradyrhizobium sp. 195]|uniref:hypothetical protein n=1 Tax=Bradyrhizobium sp. 195 TaxID=2782662 RepID=UPI002000E106|nr:hypothetical protein [Bradyrhizobium sp. 195]UPK31156.1 hypothetical protein IVB26_39055 [Bradyrhizobium sp. 195]
MTEFPLPDILHKMITGELERLQAKSVLARSAVVEHIAISSEMLWRSRQVEDKGPLPDS